MPIEGVRRFCGGVILAIWAVLFIMPAVFADEARQSSRAPAGGMDPRVKPGASITLEFPELAKTRRGEMSKMVVQLPAKYDPHKLYPIFAWMAGGDGGSFPGCAAELVDKDKFIFIGLPFPLGCNNPSQGNMVGNFPEMWKYHKAMLDELQKLVPNISPNFRILGGFSNGAHTIGGYLPMKEQDVFNWFNIYIPIEGIERGGDYGHLGGRHICVGWGEVGTCNKVGAMAMASKAEGAKMKVKRVPQPGVGHDFGADAKKTVKEWIKDVVIPDTLAQALYAMEKDKNGGYMIGKSMEVLADGTESETKFKELLAKLEEAAKKEFETVKAKCTGDLAAPARKTAIDSLRAFQKKYRYSEPSAECETMLDKFAHEDLQKLMGTFSADMKPAQRQAACAKLIQFAKEWEGTASAAEAQKSLDEYSDQAFKELRATMPEKIDPAQRAGAAVKCRKFAADWPATSGYKSAMALICELGQAELDEYMAKLPASMTPQQKKAAADDLKNVQKKWDGTPAADVFQKAIANLQEAQKS